jgi:hypothetical protein
MYDSIYAMLIFAAKLVFWRRKVGRQNKPDGCGEERDQDIGTGANRLSKECNEKNGKSSKILIELTYF